jgi:hypothetical protein
LAYRTKLPATGKRVELYTWKGLLTHIAAKTTIFHYFS